MLFNKVFQMFILGTENLDIPLKYGLGGVIFFKDDIVTSTQFKKLIFKLKNKAPVTPFLSIDQEGGRVERTTNIRKPLLSQTDAFKKGESYMIKQYTQLLSELSEFGINMNFAPCLDVNSNPQNPIINNRAFADNFNDVIKGFNIVYPLYKKYGIIPVIKHFPGHGDAAKDSHLELPVIDLTFEELYTTHIKPFESAIKSGIDAIMVAHLHCSCFDKDTIPTSLSSNCINYLKNDLKYSGLIISDDMYMKGVGDCSMDEACLKGLLAGLNVFIYRNSADDTLNVIESLIKEAEKSPVLTKVINENYNKIISIKRKHNLA